MVPNAATRRGFDRAVTAGRRAVWNRGMAERYGPGAAARIGDDRPVHPELTLISDPERE
ncbi:hypothetical protein GCM10012279_37610 [Micromonospora yangpuensis]|nr:hypothetical protein GCM10012279_37610 [Micromonospora yangpuensis]